MEGKDFLELAKKLQNSEMEADRRTSVSRAYYAIFNHIKSFFHNAHIKLPEAAQAHEKIYQYLFNSGSEEAEDLAADLKNLRVKRNDADYELISPKYNFDKHNCGLTCLQAIKFFEQFDGLNRGTLVKGIWDYKRKTNN